MRSRRIKSFHESKRLANASWQLSLSGIVITLTLILILIAIYSLHDKFANLFNETLSAIPLNSNSTVKATTSKIDLTPDTLVDAKNLNKEGFYLEKLDLELKDGSSLNEDSVFADNKVLTTIRTTKKTAVTTTATTTTATTTSATATLNRQSIKIYDRLNILIDRDLLKSLILKYS
jgi:hypothetical protein